MYDLYTPFRRQLQPHFQTLTKPPIVRIQKRNPPAPRGSDTRITSRLSPSIDGMLETFDAPITFNQSFKYGGCGIFRPIIYDDDLKILTSLGEHAAYRFLDKPSPIINRNYDGN